MSESLVIRLGTNAQQPVHWLVWSTQEQEIIASGTLASAHALGELQERAGGRPVVTLVPGSDLIFRRVSLPGKYSRQAAAALRQQLAPHKREADKLESELGKINEKLAKIETSLGDSAVYEAARKDELRDLLAEQAKLKVLESQLEERWMEALELLESMQAELEALS